MKNLLICCFISIMAVSIVFITCSPTEPEKKPQLSVNPTSCTFTKNANSYNLIISNSGGGDLSWEITNKPDWIEVSKSSGKVTTSKDTVIITADFNQNAGTYSGTINIDSNGGNQIVTVSLEISIWIKKKDMPTARLWFSCEIVDGKIYAIGGGTVSGAPTLATVEEYDPFSNTWTRKQDMPTARRSMYSAVVDGKIYIIGGDRNLYIGQTNGVRTVEVYDPTNDTWDTQNTDMPTAREGGSASAVNGIIYVIGGVKPGGVASNEVETYDPATDIWATKNSMPTARWALSTVVEDGKIYAIGGSRAGGQILRTVEIYDPGTDAWTTKASMSVGNGYFGIGIVNGIIYTMGGASDPYTPYSRVFAYDPSVDKWSEKTAMPTARFALRAGVFKGKIYSIGGSPGWPPTPLSTVEEYDPAIDPN